MQKYNTAPLPFQGQKRFFLKEVAQILSSAGEEVDTIVDLFGGSGLLSHTAKYARPDCRVIYNDFDNFSERLAHIQETEELRAAIYERLRGVQKEKRLTPEEKADVLAIIEAHGRKGGYVDFLSLSSFILFANSYAGNLEELRKCPFYNNARSTAPNADGYLEGVETTHMDYSDLFALHADNPRALFILDPPYLTTDCARYKDVKYWTLATYLDVLKLTQGNKYIYFTSNKGQLIDLCGWLQREYGDRAPLYGAKSFTRHNATTYVANYTDILLYHL